MPATNANSSRRSDVTAVHSINRIVFTVPDLADAEKFYGAFGMNLKKNGQQLDIYTHGHPHCWMSVIANGQAKALQYISFGIYAEDEEAFRQKVQQLGIGCLPPAVLDQSGLWLKSPDGILLQLIVAPKVSPNQKTPKTPPVPLPRVDASAPMRSQSSPVRPRWLSHALVFCTDISHMIKFCEDVLGLRLSDKSGDLVAFMHTPHGSDHHLLAFVKSEAAGLHHTSWDVGSLEDVGAGSEQMRTAGFPEGWGVGRHVLGSNYFYYARDPWGSFAEFSYDIDFVSPAKDWQAGDFAPEDSFYLWGPAVPEYFTVNTESPVVANTSTA